MVEWIISPGNGWTYVVLSTGYNVALRTDLCVSIFSVEPGAYTSMHIDVHNPWRIRIIPKLEML